METIIKTHKDLCINDIIQIKKKSGNFGVTNSKIISIDENRFFFTDLDYPNVGLCSYLNNSFNFLNITKKV